MFALIACFKFQEIKLIDNSATFFRQLLRLTSRAREGQKSV